ncbi:MAG: FAD-binding protein [Melioribacteraceae bacterium]|nr:FAD-binding protein [Melioribacteraceae bacterium]
MFKEIEFTVHPSRVNDDQKHKKIIAAKLDLSIKQITAINIIRRSIDSRSKIPIFRLKAEVFIDEKPKRISNTVEYKSVSGDKKVIVVGSGPAGLFAALRLIELGIKPIVLERGNDVRSRRKDLRNIQQKGIVNPDSNYCFGEGGAGTYSDGKLYTRSKKRGDVNRIIELLIQHGAAEDIRIDAHPHIGSNKLPDIIKAIRARIIANNGEVHFNSRVTDFILKDKTVKGVVINDEKEFLADSVILATGHSARDIYYLLDKHKIKIEAKPFAVGVRIEHPQPLIDKIQYHSAERHPNLPAASYALTCQVKDKGVYSFCMCPGGIIVPASTDQNELVLNGMSISTRNSPFANSGLVVSVNEKDFKKFSDKGVFAGLEYQKMIENIAWEAGGKTQQAPAQRITDFVNQKKSADLPKTSYIPGTVNYPLHEILPKNISFGLRKGIEQFGKRMKGYFTSEAQILAAETRTSSPIRIPRDKETYQHVEIKGLFPAGEGAGYAGGIISAAIDGEKCAEAAAKILG